VPADPSLNLFTAVSFLRDLRPSGPWVLTSIVPDGKTRTKTLASLQACEQFVQEEAAERKNIYYSLNPLLRVVSKKASKEDVARVEYLHVDADPRDDESPADFKARMGPLVAQLVKRPALVVDSGNGLQLLWRLQQAVEDFDLAEAANYALAKDLGADPSTRNVDRILRLPGTVNWPNKTKLRRGRVPCETRTVSSWDGSHGFEEFRQEEPADDEPTEEVSLSEALPAVDLEKLHPLVKIALEACKSQRDTSARLLVVARAMAEQGYSDDAIAAVLLNRDHPVSEHAYKRPALKRRQVARAIATIRKDARKIHGTVTDLYMLKTTHTYIDAVTRDLWPAATVDAVLPPVVVGVRDGKRVALKASKWVDQNQVVDQMTWMPGQPMVVEDCYVAAGGLVQHPGRRVFNTYLAPRPSASGDPGKADPWVDHVRKLFPESWLRIAQWLAHRLVLPHVKINHAVVLGSLIQGIGKDALLEPVIKAVGRWNCHEVSPSQLMGRFNGFLKAVILRVNEARDLGGSEDSKISRYALYDHMKNIITGDVLRIDEKHRQEHYVPNVVGVVITTNYKAGGIHIPAEDRRHYVAWSDLTLGDFEPDYFDQLYRWYDAEGYGHVEAYLRHLDLSSFDPKAPPPKTGAFWEMAAASASPEGLEISAALDEIVNTRAFRQSTQVSGDARDFRSYWPKAVTIRQVMDLAAIDSVRHDSIYKWLEDRRNRRAIQNRMEQAGYVIVMNGSSHLWYVSGKGRTAVYAQASLTPLERLSAARDLARDGWTYERAVGQAQH